MTGETGHRIRAVRPGSIAQELELEPGDRLLSIDGQIVEDVFDYQYMAQAAALTLLVEKADGEAWELEIEKDEEEDLGIEFESGLMDEYRSCSNRCIFCFIDQMPKGMRKTLYFKDDDARLSFLQGNYVTLTNLSDHDVDRILKYHLSPINISFHTTNPELRCRMLRNRFAGDALEKARRLLAPESGIHVNGQIVLCRGVNDGAQLHRTLSELFGYRPSLQSVSVVPVGLSRYREGLYPLEAFTGEDARLVLEEIRSWQDRALREDGTRFVYASDEWYFLAKEPIPPAACYDDYPQLENGVGMTRLFMDEFRAALAAYAQEERTRAPGGGSAGKRASAAPLRRTVSAVSGRLIYPVVCALYREAEAIGCGPRVLPYEITNDFFGEQITVTGLLTGQDILRQLRGKDLGERLLLPENVLRSGEDYLLDDVTTDELSQALGVPVQVVGASGRALARTLMELGREIE